MIGATMFNENYYCMLTRVYTLYHKQYGKRNLQTKVQKNFIF